MYSVVLLMAVTAGGETPDFGRRGGCCGCYGCYGCSGCYGGCRGGRGCHGCRGCYGCCGYGYGCCGTVVSYGCCGSAATTTKGGQDTGGNTGGDTSKTVTKGGGDDKLKPGTALSAEETKWLKEMTDAEKDAGEKKKIEDDFKKDSHVGRKATYEVFKKMKTGGDQQVSDRPAPATVIVKIHPSARLTVDGSPTRSTSAVRTFETPDLAPGKTFSYSLTAEFQQGGKTVTVTKLVKVEAGRMVSVDLSKANVAVVSK